MRSLICVLWIAIAAGCAAGAARGNPAGSPHDKAAIRAILAPQIAPDHLARDIDWENAFGDRVIGRDSVAAFRASIAAMFPAGSSQTMSEPRIVFIKPDVAVADYVVDVVGQVSWSGEILPTRRVRNTAVLVRQDGAWEVALLRAGDLRSHQEMQ